MRVEFQIQNSFISQIFSGPSIGSPSDKNSMIFELDFNIKNFWHDQARKLALTEQQDVLTWKLGNPIMYTYGLLCDIHTGFCFTKTLIATAYKLSTYSVAQPARPCLTKFSESTCQGLSESVVGISGSHWGKCTNVRKTKNTRGNL